MENPAHDPFLWINESLAKDRGEYADYVRLLTRGLKDFFAARGSREPEDLIQETLSIVIRKLQRQELSEGFPDEGDRRGYVFGIAKNVARDWWRKNTSKRLKEDSISEGDEQQKPLTVPPLDHAREECLKLLANVIETVTAQLDPPDRQIMLEVYLSDSKEDLSVRAARLNIPHATMRQRASRAKRRFDDAFRRADHVNDLFSCLGWGRSVK